MTSTIQIETKVVGRRTSPLPPFALPVPAEWQGQMTILSGTGDLENLHGHGTWWGLGWLGDPTVPGVIYYEGTFHLTGD